MGIASNNTNKNIFIQKEKGKKPPVGNIKLIKEQQVAYKPLGNRQYIGKKQLGKRQLVPYKPLGNRQYIDKKQLGKRQLDDAYKPLGNRQYIHKKQLGKRQLVPYKPLGNRQQVENEPLENRQLVENESLRNRQQVENEPLRYGQENEKLEKKQQLENYELIVKNKEMNNIKVSIIMPSFNKYEYVSLSLYCLLKQTFAFSEFEVILIDDCSHDQTPRIPQEFDPPFKFKYVRPSINQGRSRARNLGIKLSEGEVIIFLDGEMLTEPDFIENHYKHHAHDKKLVVTGAMHYRGIYTFLTSNLNRQQWEHIDDFVPRDPYFIFPYKEYKQNYQTSNTSFPLITKKDIDENRYKDLSFPNWYFTQVLTSGLNDFGMDLSSYKLPYIAFLTGDVSVSKEQLDRVGYFDESFLGYGAEDWELGYRFYKDGARFIMDPSTFCYHQEHPTSSNNFPEAMDNLYKFMEKFPHFDVLALALEHKPLNFVQIHYVVSQYHELCEKYPQKYREFKETYQRILFKIIENLKNSKPITKYYESDSFLAKVVTDQVNEIKAHNWYALANSFEELYSY
ncbi:glycosyltransferase family 2 protein [Peribacillus huizhouensis]|uniref:Glycosyltransferase involved in cell wall biosynthesis n=1 Tax=Peribacillus huizhouensis TaxID=1501239 RepID=A0ABR6CRX6_9BACI|nr:glycosyltransferase family 2 protein [Peribacillus huizhouensis]MBA9027403.1 glycosyltransferase involved in cell wall biosynthesis [Peribacillus huizhouensis]